MKNIISFQVCIFTALCSVFIVSCSEDSPVTSNEDPYQFDSARYDWTLYSNSNWLLDFNAFDTSNIFLLGTGNLLKYDGVNFTENYYNDQSFDPLSMGSYDKDNIYIGGNDRSVSVNNGKPRLKKWNGSTFNEITINDSTNRLYQIFCIEAINENEILMGSTKGDLIHYDNGNFEFLRIDSTFFIRMFGTDETGNSYAVATKTVFDSLTFNFFNIYKKENNQWKWTLEYSDVYTGYDLNEIRPSRIKTEISGFRNNNIVKYRNNTFQEIFQVRPIVPYPLTQLSDTSTNYFLLPGISGDRGFEFFHWNGTKWSREIDLSQKGIYSQIISKVENVDGKYFTLFQNGSNGMSMFGVGVIKNK